ncbi:MAG: thermonuclease family protein [Alphaproteobacteria bacterium]|nr:MAG: thermonuclease family protein [Alphaproteobacteria bacterium]
MMVSALVIILGLFDLLNGAQPISDDFDPPKRTLAELRGCGLKAGPVETVSRVIDGDTLVLDDGREVRLVGLQAPKLPLGRPGFKAWPLSKEAKRHLEKLTVGRHVRLLWGGSREDRHGRVLAHLLILENELQKTEGVWLAEALLLDGMARVYTFRDNRVCVPELLKVEGEARGAKRGIWGHNFYRIRDSLNLKKEINSFQLVEGEVQRAAVRSDGIYLDFGEDWRTDFSAHIAKRNIKRFEKEGLDPMRLAHKEIRLRGWLDYRNGPMMELTHPEQIEFVH